MVQWLSLSCVLGLPLMAFHMATGQYLRASVLDMWRVAPIFQVRQMMVVLIQMHNLKQMQIQQIHNVTSAWQRAFLQSDEYR